MMQHPIPNHDLTSAFPDVPARPTDFQKQAPVLQEKKDPCKIISF
jgi:hypothetical protein